AASTGEVGRRPVIVFVLLCDFGIIPGGDFASEHLGDGIWVHVQGVDAFKVESNRYRRDVGRDVEWAAGTASLFLLFAVHGRVGACEAVLTGDETFTTGAGTNWVIVDGQVWVGFGDVGGPCSHGSFLRRCTATGERTRDFSRGFFSATVVGRSEERRVGKECRSRWGPDD